MWMPEMFGVSMPVYVNFQHAFVASNVIVAVPLPVAVVCRYRPVKIALRMTVV